MKKVIGISKKKRGKKTDNARKYGFELTRAEFLSQRVQKKYLGGKTEGLVAIEKTCKSPTTWKFHYIGNRGVVDFIKKLIAGKV